MLVSSYVNGFGNSFGHGSSFGQAPSLMQFVQASLQRSRTAAGLGLTSFSTYDAFYNSNKNAYYQDAALRVFCTKDSVNRPQCALLAYKPPTASRTGPVAAMQRAVDAMINKIPDWHNRVGQQANITGPDGVTTVKTINQLPADPIAHEAGYDGVVGSSTAEYALAALILGGALKAIPNTVAGAYIEPTAANMALYSQGIADYLNDVVQNWDTYLAAYQARDSRPATDPFTPATVQALAPYIPTTGVSKAAILGVAAAMLGLTTIAAISAAKHKPGMMYDMPAPALGRGRGDRRDRLRAVVLHRPRSW